ncbi:MAG TPA: response regulator [Cytophagales bacterium]|nr:response regulator [Cytophagales bacterium]
MRKLNSICLIDDDHTTNFVHKTIIEDLEIAENIEIFEDGEDAFQFIKSSCFIGECPELILLDINMPCANGFDFLEAFNLLEFADKSNVVIVILSTSALKVDVEKAHTFNINDYLVKPLTKEVLKDLIKKHFNYTIAPNTKE